MNSREITKGIFWAALQLTGLCIIIWLLFQLKTLIIYMIIAGIISLIGRPINHLLINRIKIKPVLATTISILILLGFLISLFSLFVPLLIRQGENLSLLDVDLLKENIETLVNEISIYFQLDNSFWQQQISVDNLFKMLTWYYSRIFKSNIRIIRRLYYWVFSVVLFYSFFSRILIYNKN